MNVHQRMATRLVFNSPSALTNLSYHSLLYWPRNGTGLKTSGRTSSPRASLKSYSWSRSCFLHHGSRKKEALCDSLGHSICSVVSFLLFFWTEPKSPNTTSSPPCLCKTRWGLFTLELLRHCWVLSYRWELFPSWSPPIQDSLVLCRHGSRHLSWSSGFCGLTPVMLNSWKLVQPSAPHSACSFTTPFQPAKPSLEQL